MKMKWKERDNKVNLVWSSFNTELSSNLVPWLLTEKSTAWRELRET